MITIPAALALPVTAALPASATPFPFDRIHCKPIRAGKVKLSRCEFVPENPVPPRPLSAPPAPTAQELDLPPASPGLPPDGPSPEEWVPAPWSPLLPSSSLPRQEHILHVLLNRARVRRGLRTLTLDPKLSAVARAHSQVMCRQSFFDHRSPAGDTPWQRLRQANITFVAAAENIAAGYSTARAAHDGWMASPRHRANRLDPSFTRAGFGIYRCAGETMYWTEVFVR